MSITTPTIQTPVPSIRRASWSAHRLTWLLIAAAVAATAIVTALVVAGTDTDDAVEPSVWSTTFADRGSISAIDADVRTDLRTEAPAGADGATAPSLLDQSITARDHSLTMDEFHIGTTTDGGHRFVPTRRDPEL